MTADIPQDILVVDPGMAQSFGHHYAYNQALQGRFTANGAQGRFLFSRNLPPELLAEFSNARAVFTWSPYAWPQTAGAGPIEAMRHAAEAFAEELRAHVQADARTTVFAHTLDPTALYGFALWQADLPENQRPFLALNLMLGMADAPDCRALLAPSRALLGQTGKTRLFGGSKAAARMLSELFGAPCLMLPTPLPDALGRYRASTPPGAPVFGLIGDARQGKNLHILPPAMLRYLASGGRGEFRIQLTATDEALAPVLLALHDLSREYPERVRLEWRRRLADEEYHACLGSFTALIIPYSAQSYHVCRPSGPVIEAAALGVPVIACAGGFAQDELAPLDNGSLFMESAAPAPLAQALARFEREKDERKAKALAAAIPYAASHGTDAIMRLL